MPNQLVLPVTPGTLPGGSCPATGDYQGLLNLIAQNLSVTFPSSFSGLTASATPPSDQTQSWLQLDSNGRPVRLYYFAAGSWVSQHPLAPGFVMIWPSALPDFTTFDGGDSNAASAISGPMWQQAQDSGGNPILRAQFPFGVGTLPSSALIAVGSSGGEETHPLTIPEMPPHTHTMGQFGKASATGNNATTAGGLVGYGVGAAGSVDTNPDITGGTGTPPVVAPHNNLPPYYGVYFLQRTTRLFYSV